jgi:hypothetical protein
LAAGATHIERIDLLIKLIADQHGLRSDSVDETERRVHGWLDRNRHASSSPATQIKGPEVVS